MNSIGRVDPTTLPRQQSALRSTMQPSGTASASSTVAIRQQPQVTYSIPAASSSPSPRHDGVPSTSFRAEDSRYSAAFLNYPAARSASPSPGGTNSQYSPSMPIFSTLDGSIETVFLNAGRVFAQVGIHGEVASLGRNPGCREERSLPVQKRRRRARPRGRHPSDQPRGSGRRRRWRRRRRRRWRR